MRLAPTGRGPVIPVLLGAVLVAAPPPPRRVVVAPVEAIRTDDQELARSLQAPLEFALDRLPELTVVSSDELRVLIEQAMQADRLAGVDEEQRRAKVTGIASKFNVGRVAYARLSGAGDSYVVSLALLEREATLARSERYASSPDEVLKSVPQLVEALGENLRAQAAVTSPPNLVAPGVVGAVGLGILASSAALGFTAIEDGDLRRARAADGLLWVGGAALAAGVTWLVLELTAD